MIHTKEMMMVCKMIVIKIYPNMVYWDDLRFMTTIY